MSSAGIQPVSLPDVKHEDEDHLMLRLSFKATLKRISDLDYPEMESSTPGGPHPHGCSLALWRRARKVTPRRKQRASV